MTLPIKPPFPPMEALLVMKSQPATNGNTSQSGTAFAVWRFATARKSSCNRSPASRSRVTFRKSSMRSLKLKATKFVLDGELVIPVQGRIFRLTICCSEFIPPPAACRNCRRKLPHTSSSSICWLMTQAKQFMSCRSQASPQARKLRKKVSGQKQEHRAVTENQKRSLSSQVALNFGDEIRRRDCQASGSSLSIGRARRHAKSEKDAHGRLCGRRISVCVKRESRRFVVAGLV